jgi:hypothetical protein
MDGGDEDFRRRGKSERADDTMVFTKANTMRKTKTPNLGSRS